MIISFWFRFRLLAGICLLLIGIHLINLMTGDGLRSFGIYPRNVDRLPFILTAPFIHGSWQHLINNLMGLTIFSSICLMRSTRFYLWASLFIIIVTGVLVWLFARSSMHIGASGLIFGLWSLCIAMAWFERSFQNIFIAIIVIVLYGGMAIGVLPSEPGISFESHFFGAVAGVLCAAVASKLPKRGALRAY